MAILAVVTRLAGPSEQAVIPSETWAWTSAGVEVARTTARSPFQVGDVVVAMDGRPLAAWIEAATRLESDPGVRPGSIVTFDVVRAGQPIRLAVTLESFTLERVGDAPLGLLGFGGGVLVLATTLLMRRPRSTVLRLLFVGAAANIADISAWVIGIQPTDFRTGSAFLVAFGAAAVFNVVFWSTIVHILTVYPVRSPLAVRHRLVVPIIYAAPLASVAVLLVASRAFGGTTLDWIGRFASVIGFVASTMLVLILASTVAGYRRASPAVRRGVRDIALALGFAAIATLALLTLPIALSGVPLVPRSTVAVLAAPVPIAVLVAVLRDRLFQVALLSRSREKIVAAREDERRKLRRDLHDGLAPTLAAAGLTLDHARHAVRSDPDAAELAIDEARRAVRGTIQEIRRLSRELRPPALDALGLVGAIREQAEALGGRSANGPVIIVDAPLDLPALPAAIEVAAYRIAVEGMMNVVRHAAATTCHVGIEIAEDQLRIEVVDDGIGMSAADSGVGLRSVRERADEVGGDVTIEPSPKSGTHLLARLPVDLSVLRPGLA